MIYKQSWRHYDISSCCREADDARILSETFSTE